MRSSILSDMSYDLDSRVRGARRKRHAPEFDEDNMVLMYPVPECEEACCNPPAYAQYHPQTNTSVLVYIYEKNGSTAPLGHGHNYSVNQLVDYINAEWERNRVPVEHPEFVAVPARMTVCPTCAGRGKHVNPSIDSHGLGSEDFDSDPDFAEAYFSGGYDVTCYECGGRRVIPVPDESALSVEQQAILERHEAMLESLAEMDAESRAERRMGA